jgi:DNA-binding MarR family transcriptional regulator
MTKQSTKPRDRELAENLRVITEEKYEVSVNLRRKKINVETDWTMLFQKVVLKASKTLQPSSCKVLFYFLGSTGYGNHFECHLETIIEEIQISRATANRAIRELINNNVIIKSKSSMDHRLNCYCVNPDIAWKGQVKLRKIAKSKLDPAQLAMFVQAPHSLLKMS